MLDREPITREGKPFIQSMYDFLGLNILKLHHVEKLYLKMITSGINLKISTNYDISGSEVDEYTRTELVDKQISGKIRNLVFENGQKSSFEEVMESVALDHIDLPKSKHDSIKDSLITKNFIDRVFEKKGNCLEWSVSGLLIGKLYYPDLQIFIVPYNEIARKRNYSSLIGSDHFGLVTYDGKDYKIIVDGGESISFTVLNNSEKLNSILNETVGINGRLNERQRRDLISSFKSIRRSFETNYGNQPTRLQ